MNINEIWQSEDEEIWKKALTEAMVETGRDNCIETKLSRINIDYVSQLEVEDFYDFLYDSYFVWKYTAKNRLATSRSHSAGRLEILTLFYGISGSISYLK